VRSLDPVQAGWLGFFTLTQRRDRASKGRKDERETDTKSDGAHLPSPVPRNNCRASESVLTFAAFLDLFSANGGR
jgi:hypothetical protein